MRYLKMFALTAMAAAALTAILGAGTASAEPTELYSGNTTLPAGTTIHATLEPDTSALLSTTDGSSIVDTCTGSTVHGDTNVATGNPLTGTITALTWSGCSFPTVTLKNGSLSITKIKGTDNGTVSGSGSEVTVNIGVSCRYGTGAGAHLGTLTGKTGLNEHATMDINAIINEQEPKAFLCPDTTRWVASYVVTTPTGLNVRE